MMLISLTVAIDFMVMFMVFFSKCHVSFANKRGTQLMTMSIVVVFCNFLIRKLVTSIIYIFEMINGAQLLMSGRTTYY
jgi:hypothetical protein